PQTRSRASASVPACSAPPTTAVASTARSTTATSTGSSSTSPDRVRATAAGHPDPHLLATPTPSGRRPPASLADEDAVVCAYDECAGGVDLALHRLAHVLYDLRPGPAGLWLVDVPHACDVVRGDRRRCEHDGWEVAWPEAGDASKGRAKLLFAVLEREHLRRGVPHLPAGRRPPQGRFDQHAEAPHVLAAVGHHDAPATGT